MQNLPCTVKRNKPAKTYGYLFGPQAIPSGGKEVLLEKLVDQKTKFGKCGFSGLTEIGDRSHLSRKTKLENIG